MDWMSPEQRKSVLKAYRRRHMSRGNKLNRMLELNNVGPTYRELFRVLYKYRCMPLSIGFLRNNVVLGHYELGIERNLQLGSFHQAITKLRKCLTKTEWEIRMFKEPGQRQAYGYGLYRKNSPHLITWCKPHGNYTKPNYPMIEGDLEVLGG